MLGFSLLPVFVLTKVALIRHFTDVNLLTVSGVRRAFLPTLFGSDVLLCGALAVVYLGMFRATRALGRAAAWARWIPIGLIHLVLVGIEVVELKVHGRFGKPLSFYLTAMMGDVRVFSDSITASIDWSTGEQAAVGVASLALAIGLVSGRPSALATLLARFGPKRRATLWGWALAPGAVTTAVCVVTLLNVDTCGLKTNPAVSLALSYLPSRSPPDVWARVARERRLLGGDTALHLGSLSRPRLELPGLPGIRGAAVGMNLVLVVLESTPARYVTARDTPRLRQLADDHSIEFSHYFSINPNTFDGHYALLYSEYPGLDGAVLQALHRGPPDGTSIAERFREAGYRTALFHSSYGTYVNMRWLWEGKGIDDIVAGEQLLESAPAAASWGVPDAVTADALARWIRAHASERFFAVYSPVGTHHPYQVWENGTIVRRGSVEERYGNALRSVDRTLGTIVDEVASLGLAERTVIAVVSDHGEIVAEDGGHGLTFGSAEAHVPFILHGPPFVGHTVVPTFTNHVDFAPTIAALFGLSGADRWSGRDLLAPMVPARMLFVLVRQAGIAGLIDNGIAFGVRGEHAGDAYRVGDLEFEPLPPSAVPQPMLEAYRSALRSFDARVLLSHVDAPRGPPPAPSVQQIGLGAGGPDVPPVQLHPTRYDVERAGRRPSSRPPAPSGG
jgi:phosphoglycerol transferase MdoB-like AlkP superfamily enzyme